ncbi:MAG: hypothetical protein SFU56_21820 [Capsulimonadales bacterium]|nr:hypothetical protein [Capsulimonadales bacterium]
MSIVAIEIDSPEVRISEETRMTVSDVSLHYEPSGGVLTYTDSETGEVKQLPVEQVNEVYTQLSRVFWVQLKRNASTGFAPVTIDLHRKGKDFVFEMRSAFQSTNLTVPAPTVIELAWGVTPTQHVTSIAFR